ncbi:polymorphic toxin type 44 domain-containing protein [Micromonospora sp. NPDC049559]|uniref:polymorphic toxin type 44 domain-containing protein n=1 Tax=Micromonospora sp. NPDC049559 TaxID=3155923 RepID=UPI00344A3945
MNSIVKQRVVPLLLALTTIGGGVAAVTGVSQAKGAEGPRTQISFCAQSGALRGGYAIAKGGRDKSGKAVKARKVRLRSGGQCDNLSGVWFRDRTSISWYALSGKRYRTTTCELLFPKNGGTWQRCNETPVHDQLVDYIHQEIVGNQHTSAFQELRRQCAKEGVARTGCYLAFTYLVRPGARWDHKGEIGQKWGKDGLLDTGAYWFPVPGTRYLLSYEVWSNLHYGYIGRAAGLTEPELRLGHQLPGTGRTDDGDRAMVELGLRLYRAHPVTVTEDDIRRVILDALPELTKRGKARHLDS